MGRSDKKAKAPLRRTVSESAAPSRGQRKRALKKASLVSKIRLTKRARESPEDNELPPAPVPAKGDGDAAATQARLSNTRVKGSAFQRVVSNKGKRKLMSAEMGQLTAVLNAAEFQQDPFAAIQAHLRQTACPAPLTVDADKARRPGVSAKKLRVGQHSTKKRGGREDKKPSAKPYKGRNAKMRTK